MQYMILIYGDETIYRNMSEAEMGKLMADFGSYSKALVDAGVMRSGSELAPVHTATTVRRTGGKLVCTDGPFAETKEQLGGYYLIDCANLDEAIAWAGKCPAADTGSIEIRPLV
jgi:hypothetical protein